MTTYFNPPPTWASEPRKIAVQLRDCIHLPGLVVRTQGVTVNLSWVDGPAHPPVSRELLGQMPYEHVGVRISRLYTPAAFGAALISPDATDLTGWERVCAAARALKIRDLTTDPFTADELDLGRTLAMLARVPLHAFVDFRGVKRYEDRMSDWLMLYGEAALHAVLMRPSD